MKRLEDLLLRQTTDREIPDPIPTVPDRDATVRAQSPVPDTPLVTPRAETPQETVVPPPVPVAVSGTMLPEMVGAEERERMMEQLNEFRRCTPRIFDGEKADHWVVEKWLMHMEKLCYDTFVEERYRVWFATHHLDGEAYRWWVDIRENPRTDLSAITWNRFKDLLLTTYFPQSVKRQMKRDKARIFKVGLRPAIFRLVQASNLSTYRDVVNRALIVEKGAEIMKERDIVDRGKGKRPAAESSGQQSLKRPPKYPRGQSGQSRGRGSSARRGAPERRPQPRCVICGGPHVPPQCPQRGGRCFLCGQEGHFRSECLRGSLPVPSSASAPASSAPSQGTLTTPYQSRRPPGQRQSESSQQGSSGRIYAAQTEGAAASEEVVAVRPLQPG
ncbi:uncharacterized protein LOC109719386 [Ananas comosus]|uniref:Uncharacterized protein LOC109719386 n=1 Tax=Ananas comosus TaxID=4615 RepID=A0A6P5G8P2_ANACO|nr:uncharacterized protein LOC109719386 [Ananas comosus]